MRTIMPRETIHRFIDFAWRLAIATILVCLPIESAHAQEKSAPTLLILFDASGSMWGKTPDGSNAKFETARAAIKSSLQEIDKAPKSGLIIFGGNCTGVKIAVPPTAAAGDDISRQLADLNPRSKGPISLALRSAKELLDPKTSSTIVLIHDGTDNCRQDPCEAAAELAKSHKQTTVNLISIDNSRADAAAMQCVAKKMHGKVFVANNAGQIQSAIKKIIAALEPKTPTIAVPKAVPATRKGKRAKSNIDPNGPPHLSLYATLTNNGSDVTTPVRWQVYKKDEQNIPVLDVVEQSFTTPLPAGDYFVKAALGLAKNSQNVAVATKGETILTLSLSAGTIIFPAIKQKTTQTASTETDAIPTFLSLKHMTSSETEKAAAATPILLNTRADNHLTLPAGKYTATLEHGASRLAKVITVAEGTTQVINMTFATGELRLEAQTTLGTTLDNAPLFKVFIDDPEAKGGRLELARSAAPNPVFALPAGTYYITAQQGHARASSNVALSAGASIHKKINLDIARLHLRYDLEIDAGRSILPVQYTVSESTGPKGKTIATTGDPTPVFDLPPGSYRIVAQIGARNVLAETQIELAPGANETVTVSAAAGQAHLKLSGTASSQTVDRFWEVRDHENKVIWRTNQFAPKALLAPGKYMVKCETRGGRTQKEFVLASGERQIIELDIP